MDAVAWAAERRQQALPQLARQPVERRQAAVVDVAAVVAAVDVAAERQLSFPRYPAFPTSPNTASTLASPISAA